jgi:hypothetical protein
VNNYFNGILQGARDSPVSVSGDGLGRSGCRRGTRRAPQDRSRSRVCVSLATPPMADVLAAPMAVAAAKALERISAGRGGHKGGHRDTHGEIKKRMKPLCGQHLSDPADEFYRRPAAAGETENDAGGDETAQGALTLSRAISQSAVSRVCSMCSGHARLALTIKKQVIVTLRTSFLSSLFFLVLAAVYRANFLWYI